VSGRACERKPNSTLESDYPERDIADIIARHGQELLGMEGVVGVYAGLAEDGSTPCIVVMLARDEPDLKRPLPRSIEGYAVVAEITGEIRPMDS